MVKDSNNNVLFLSYDGLTDPLGQSQILPYLCGLSETYTINIISFEKKDRFVKGKAMIQQICAKHNLVWIPLLYHRKPPVFSTLYDLWRLRRTAASLHRINAIKIVHCRSYITALVGLWMKRNFDVKFIFDMRGFWADERVEGSLWNLKNPLYRLIYNFFKKKELEFLIEADHVISLTHNAKNEIVSWKVATPVSIIPCCVDLEHFNRNNIDSEKQGLLRQSLGISDNDFVLLYLGSLGTWYMVNEMLLFFSVLKEYEPNAKFLIVSMDKWDFSNHPYKTDIILKQAERRDVPLYISLAAASILFIKPTFSKKASSATKMAEVLAMNIPIVANKGWGDTEDIIEGLKCGVILDEMERKDYTKSVEELIAVVEGSSLNFTELIRDNFSLVEGVARYTKVYAACN